MIVLVHGPDAATARAEVSKLITAQDPGGNSTTKLDGREISISQAAAMVGTPGFLGQARVIVIEDLITRSVKGKSGDSFGGDREAFAPSRLDLAPLFKSVAPGNALILIDLTLSLVPAAVKKLIPPDTQVIAGEPPRGKALLDWMGLIARQSGSDLASGNATYLAEFLYPQTWAAKPSNPQYDRPPDLELLKGEIGKLALFAHPGPIERHHVDEMTDVAHADRMFPFIEAAMSGAVGTAVAELEALKQAAEDGHRLVAQLLQQIELSAAQEEAGARNDPVEIGRALGLSNPNRMIGIARTRRAVPATFALREARLLDRAVKTGELRDPMDVLYALVLSLTARRGVQKDRRRAASGPPSTSTAH